MRREKTDQIDVTLDNVRGAFRSRTRIGPQRPPAYRWLLTLGAARDAGQLNGWLRCIS